jgi:DNA-directed RNA polymerase subunit RPC12/RpoP
MSQNMTVCPECGTAFETVAQETELPSQALKQDCPDCGYTVEVSILNYPDGMYTVIAPALKGDTCKQCDNGAMIRMQQIGCPIEGRCAEHMGAHHEAALDLRSKL